MSAPGPRRRVQDARGDVFRGLEVVEHSCGMGSLLMGETSENVKTFSPFYCVLFALERTR